MKEIWEVWHPQGHIIYKPYTYSVINYDSSQLLITLSNDKSKAQNAVEINFYNGAYSSTILLGPYIKKLRNNLVQEYGEEFFQNSSCFKIQNSLYIEWASFQSYEMVSLPYAQHFCIFAHEYLVHLIAPYEPHVTFLDEKE